jgi:3-deoxy-7-phosphoheptulonate synthase
MSTATAASSPEATAPLEVSGPYRLAARRSRPEGTVVRFGSLALGVPGDPVIMAGPCAIESEEQAWAIARRVADAGARFMRGGAFKPRTSPYSFQGMGVEGLRILHQAARAHGLLVVTEVMDTEHMELVAQYADLLQIGSRNMANYALLSAVGAMGRPVLLKRGNAATLEEFLCAAEYLLVAGTREVVLCERGVRGFDPSTRNVLDLAAVPILKSLTHLPVIVDPSHGCGRRDIVPAMSKAALVAGADGLLVEVALDPATALSDGAQSLTLDGFDALMREVRGLRDYLNQDPTAMR